MQRFVLAPDALPDQQRKVLSFCRGVGLTPTETAEEMGKAANAVRVALHRGLARFAAFQERLDTDSGG
tara:strand:- start:1825 stop:2028 length:204 start_codon:yes stop_codon:yes gene_type:complete